MADTNISIAKIAAGNDVYSVADEQSRNNIIEIDKHLIQVDDNIDEIMRGIEANDISIPNAKKYSDEQLDYFKRHLAVPDGNEGLFNNSIGQVWVEDFDPAAVQFKWVNNSECTVYNNGQFKEKRLRHADCVYYENNEWGGLKGWVNRNDCNISGGGQWKYWTHCAYSQTSRDLTMEPWENRTVCQMTQVANSNSVVMKYDKFADCTETENNDWGGLKDWQSISDCNNSNWKRRSGDCDCVCPPNGTTFKDLDCGDINTYISYGNVGYGNMVCTGNIYQKANRVVHKNTSDVWNVVFDVCQSTSLFCHDDCSDCDCDCDCNGGEGNCNCMSYCECDCSDCKFDCGDSGNCNMYWNNCYVFYSDCFKNYNNCNMSYADCNAYWNNCNLYWTNCYVK